MLVTYISDYHSSKNQNHYPFPVRHYHHAADVGNCKHGKTRKRESSFIPNFDVVDILHTIEQCVSILAILDAFIHLRDSFFPFFFFRIFLYPLFQRLYCKKQLCVTNNFIRLCRPKTCPGDNFLQFVYYCLLLFSTNIDN